jgi:GntR family transcriptional repressor for pyruvate dehydrogenase complex
VLFDAIKGEKFAEKIARKIMAMIGSGELKPNDVLPPERELAASFQVSRAVVREALGMLAVRGLINIRQGKPTTVNDVSSWNTLDPQVLLLLRKEGTLHELMELRFMIEPEAAALAASRVTDEELAALRPFLDPSHNVTMVRHVEADMAFHQGIVRATHNAVLLVVMSSVGDLLRESRCLTFQAPEAIPLAASWHEAIMAALGRHDADAARNAMTGHLRQVQAALQDFAASHSGLDKGIWFLE